MNLINKARKIVDSRLSLNKIISFLILSDFFILAGWGLVSPIFAVFITDQVAGAGVEVVGLASTIYLLLKSGLQVPLANVIDRIRGEKDDFLAMIIGSIIITIVPLLYIFVRTVPQLFMVQALYGIGGALSYPSWMALFTRHVDKQKEGWSWSIYYTTIDLSGAAVAAIGGYLAQTVGFDYLFLLVFGFSLVGSTVLLEIRANLK